MKLPSMCYRKLRGDLIVVFKYTHNIYKLSDNLLKLKSVTNTRGHSYKLKKQICNTTLRSTFSHRIVARWNSLPAEVAEAPSLNAFKNRVDLFMHDMCIVSKSLPSVLDLGIDNQNIDNIRLGYRL